ncbi:MAG: YceI family protein [Thiolinea sp.]
MQNLMIKTSALVLGMSLLAGSALAEWTLDNENSVLYYASIKKETVSEINSFKTLSGGISDAGLATLEVDLASVDTKVEIRDQRMQQYFFETDKFTTATAMIDLGDDGVKPGEHEVTAKLNLHGVEKDVAAKVMVMEEGDTLSVFTLAPVMVNSSDFGLDAGIDMLKKLAQLDSINKAVPVTFLLTFKKQ